MTEQEEQNQNQGTGSAQGWLAGASFYLYRSSVCFDMGLCNRCKRVVEWEVYTIVDYVHGTGTHLPVTDHLDLYLHCPVGLACIRQCS